MKKEFTPKTLADYFKYSISAFADNKAYSIIKGESLTFKEFGQRVKDLVKTFDENGIKDGAKIALLGGSMPNWPVAYMAATTSARIIVPLLPDFTAFEIANILEHSECKAIIISKRLIYKLSDAMRERLEFIICLDTLEILKVPSDNNLDNTDLIEPQPAQVPHREPKQDDTASIIYTSGTSGQSKGVILTHRNIVANLKMIYELYPVDQNDVFLSILPLSHAYECTIGMIYPMTEGSSVYYLDGAPTPSLLMPALKNIRPSIMLSVPLIVEKIYKNKVRPMFTKNWFMQFVYSIGPVRRLLHMVAGKKLVEMFGGRLRFFGIGGAKLDASVERFLKDAKFPYAIGYGLTECSPLLAGAVGKFPLQTTGPILKQMQVRIADANSNGIGEIQVKGDNVMQGYYKDPLRTEAAFTPDGWFRTKDLGKLDKKGNIYIKGRVDNMMLGANGENIYPEEIESIIRENDFVLECIVVRKNDKMIAKVYFNYDQIEALKEFNELSYDEKLANIKKELLENVNDKVNKSSKISEIVEQQVPFEKTATQKIKRFLYT
ncbi:MAG: long-chain fatty acid--CoA ligase [Bacteroidales bacterium]|nr:long-chain fatty acid--CoA ligase [Bacteroidales bacterium]